MPNTDNAPDGDFFSYSLIDGGSGISGFADQPISFAGTAPVAVENAERSVAENAVLITGCDRCMTSRQRMAARRFTALPVSTHRVW